MIGIALDRTLSRIIACSDVRQAEQGDTSHGRQDKSRKVRPVGRSGNASNFSQATNIAKNWHNLPFLLGRCSCSAFDTLRWAR
jgi:hypothetical protein